ncbi:MAG: Sec-independent protein translocase protein TatB [Zoogloeaceae bacterium]|nr:Sec-independent protein translocase protein TatB [Zoogloeaceae bacterium]
MFDVGFSELLVIALVALIVLGPERLPRVARAAGLLLGRAQRYVNTVKAEISSEMQLDDLKKLRSDVEDSAREFSTSLRQEWKSIQEETASVLDDAARGFRDEEKTDAAPLAEAPPALPPLSDIPAEASRATSHAFDQTRPVA